jgi:predicted short-subunit dehydrogenase-like oxidoreductase (DUF2520 family)
MAGRTPSRKRAGPPSRKSRTAEHASLPSLAIVGVGRTGGALALGLQRAGWPVRIFPRSGQSTRRAAALHLPLADHEALQQADVCVLAVPDNAVPLATKMVLSDLGRQTALVHCSGALDLSAFGSDPGVLERPRGSFHPLVAISDPRDDLSGHFAALSTNSEGLRDILRAMAKDLGLSLLEVPESGRAAYHAGAVLAAAGAIALASSAVAAFAEAGIDEPTAIRALLPLMRSALSGIERRGFSRALTGPIIRGDVAVIRGHLEALPTELKGLYRDLALRALSLVRAQLPKETRIALEQGLNITTG